MVVLVLLVKFLHQMVQQHIGLQLSVLKELKELKELLALKVLLVLKVQQALKVLKVQLHQLLVHKV
jgi:hypothetical protein